MYLYLLRHGVTEWNSQYKIQGASDIPLNQKGEEMAGQTGKTLKNKGVIFDAVYSSPLVRAMRSAVLVSDSKEIHPDERLREMGFGRQEGETVLRMAESDMPFRYFKENPKGVNEMCKVCCIC